MIATKIKQSIKQYRKARAVLNGNKAHKIAVEVNEEEKKMLQQIKEKGFVTIPEYYSREKCTELITDIENVFQSYPQFVWKDAMEADHRIYGADRISAKIRAFHEDPFLNKMATAFNEAPTINSHTLVGKITAKPNNLGSGQGWHRDTASPFQFKSILYLTDVSEANGPFEFIGGTQTINSLYKGIWSIGANSNQNRFTDKEVNSLLTKSSYKKITFTAEAGTLILVNTFSIHRGKPITQGERYALTNYFFADHTIDEQFMEHKFNLPPKDTI